MKKLLVAIIAMVAILHVTAQDLSMLPENIKQANLYQTLGITGYSKTYKDAYSTTLTKVQLDKNGQIIKREFYSNGNLSSSVEYTYENNKLLKTTSSTGGWEVYQYNSEGKLEAQIIGFGKDSSVLHTYEYETTGKLSLIKSFSCYDVIPSKINRALPEETMSFKYDEKGRVKNIITKLELGETQQTFTYVNEALTTIEESSKNSSENSYEKLSTTTFQYNKDGTISQKLFKEFEFHTSNTTTYSYTLTQ